MAIDASSDEFVFDGFRSALRQVQVVVIRTEGIGMSLNLDGQFWIDVQYFNRIFQSRIKVRLDFVAVEIEEDAVVCPAAIFIDFSAFRCVGAFVQAVVDAVIVVIELRAFLTGEPGLKDVFDEIAHAGRVGYGIDVGGKAAVRNIRDFLQVGLARGVLFVTNPNRVNTQSSP